MHQHLLQLWVDHLTSNATWVLTNLSRGLTDMLLRLLKKLLLHILTSASLLGVGALDAVGVGMLLTCLHVLHFLALLETLGSHILWHLHVVHHHLTHLLRLLTHVLAHLTWARLLTGHVSGT